MTGAVTNRIELRIGVRGIITPTMDAFGRDLRLAIRRLRLNPGFTLVAGDAVSGGYFALVGVAPRLGRVLTPNDERDASRVVVLSESFWHTHFHADPGVIGQTVRLAGTPFEVVGVAHGAFHGLQRFPS